jgi:translation initiation factor 2A
VTVSNAHFSPSNDLLVIIQKPAVPNNLKVIDLKSFTTVKYFKINKKFNSSHQIFAFHSTTHPSSQWPQIQFSSDENFIFKLIKGQLDIFNFKSIIEQKKITPDEKYGSITGIVSYELSEINTDQLTETAIICGRVVTDEKSKKKKSLVSVYKLSDLTKAVKEMTVSVCDRMKIKVSPDRKNVLLQSISDDTSATSYYGESSLYFLDLLYGKFQKISLAEGPIHDFDWTPDSTNFITTAGYQPSKTHIYNNTAKFLKEICVSKVSTIRISPDSKILCMAGFGNLNGDIEIYRLSDFKLIGKTKLYCGVTLNWSSDSKFLLGAVLSPRVRVDNEYKIFSYNGEDVSGEKFNGEIYECEWVDNKGKK